MLRAQADFDVENSGNWSALGRLLDEAAVGREDVGRNGLALAVVTGRGYAALDAVVGGRLPETTYSGRLPLLPTSL
jgi:hypothetical protein